MCAAEKRAGVPPLSVMERRAAVRCCVCGRIPKRRFLVPRDKKERAEWSRILRTPFVKVDVHLCDAHFPAEMLKFKRRRKFMRPLPWDPTTRQVVREEEEATPLAHQDDRAESVDEDAPPRKCRSSRRLASKNSNRAKGSLRKLSDSTDNGFAQWENRPRTDETTPLALPNADNSLVQPSPSAGQPTSTGPTAQGQLVLTDQLRPVPTPPAPKPAPTATSRSRRKSLYLCQRRGSPQPLTTSDDLKEALNREMRAERQKALRDLNQILRNSSSGSTRLNTDASPRMPVTTSSKQCTFRLVEPSRVLESLGLDADLRMAVDKARRKASAQRLVNPPQPNQRIRLLMWKPSGLGKGGVQREARRGQRTDYEHDGLEPPPRLECHWMKDVPQNNIEKRDPEPSGTVNFLKTCTKERRRSRVNRATLDMDSASSSAAQVKCEPDQSPEQPRTARLRCNEVRTTDEPENGRTGFDDNLGDLSTTTTSRNTSRAHELRSVKVEQTCEELPEESNREPEQSRDALSVEQQQEMLGQCSPADESEPGALKTTPAITSSTADDGPTESLQYTLASLSSLRRLRFCPLCGRPVRGQVQLVQAGVLTRLRYSCSADCTQWQPCFTPGLRESDQQAQSNRQLALAAHCANITSQQLQILCEQLGMYVPDLTSSAEAQTLDTPPSSV